jgi:hypothetical protein
MENDILKSLSHIWNLKPYHKNNWTTFLSFYNRHLIFPIPFFSFLPLHLVAEAEEAYLKSSP